MKKLSGVILSLMLAIAMPVAAMAADFVPSAEAKLAPNVVNSSMNIVRAEDLRLVVTPLAEADKAPAPIRDSLYAAYDELLTTDDLGSIIPNLADVVSSAGIYSTTASGIATDLFDVSLLDSNDNQVTLSEGESVTVTFEHTYDTENFHFVVAHKNSISNQWEALENEDVVTGDGTVTTTLNQLCPVVFILVPKNKTAPQTIDYTGYIFCGLAVAAAGTVIGVAVKSKKKEN